MGKYKLFSKESLLILGIFFRLFLNYTVVLFLLRMTSGGNLLQNIFIIIYFVLSFRFEYLRWKSNSAELRLLSVAILTCLINLLHGSSNSTYTGDYLFYMFCMPTICILCIKYTSESVKHILRILVVSFFIINCSLAIYEKIMLINYFPVFEEDSYQMVVTNATIQGFRSTSLMGHPLVNANIIVLLYSFFALNIKKLLHFILLSSFTLISLASFDARAATAIFLIIVLILFFQKYIVNGRYKITGILLLFVVGFLILNVFAQSDIAGRLFQGDIKDDSAQTRFYFVSQIKSLYFYDFIFGFPHRKDILFMSNGLQNENGLFLFVGYWGIITLFLYIYSYYKLIKYYLVKSNFTHMFIIVIGCFGIAIANPNFLRSTIVICFAICLALFSPRALRKN